MIRKPAYSSLISRSYLIRMLFGLWLFFTITFGFFSDWVFETLMNIPDDPKFDAVLYTATYSGILISLFGFAWTFLNKRYPITQPKNLIIHGSVQLVILVVGFVLGTIITGYLHSVIFQSDNVDESKSIISLAFIGMMCIVGLLMTAGLVYFTYYIKATLEAEKRNTQSQLNALRAQINPHFLFNSLNSIAALIRISPKDAESVTEDLADVFRYTLRSSDQPLVSLKDELEIIQLYLNIEQARFKERLNVEIHVEDNLQHTSLPVLTLQPLIENSIKHGVSKKEGNHTVSLAIKRHGELLEIHINDTGPGFPHYDFERIMNNGTGLSNVFQRLRLHFGEQVDGSISEHGLQLRFPIHSLSNTITKDSTIKTIHEGISS